MKLLSISPKAILAAITGSTGVVAPSIVAGEKSKEVSSLTAKIEDMKDYDEIKKDVEEKNRRVEKLQDAISRIIDAAKQKHEADRRIMENLDRDKKNMLEVLRKNRDIKALAEYISDRCAYGLCSDLSAVNKDSKAE